MVYLLFASHFYSFSSFRRQCDNRQQQKLRLNLIATAHVFNNNNTVCTKVICHRLYIFTVSECFFFISSSFNVYAFKDLAHETYRLNYTVDMLNEWVEILCRMYSYFLYFFQFGRFFAFVLCFPLRVMARFHIVIVLRNILQKWRGNGKATNNNREKCKKKESTTQKRQPYALTLTNT